MSTHSLFDVNLNKGGDNMLVKVVDDINLEMLSNALDYKGRIPKD